MTLSMRVGHVIPPTVAAFIRILVSCARVCVRGISSSANVAEEELDSISAVKIVKQWPLLTYIKACIG